MKEVRYFYAPEAGESNELPEAEAQHALRVLRLTEGDDIFLMDGKGTFYKAKVTMASKKHCLYTITDTLPREKSWSGHIHLAIAPTKMMERMEWMVEKCVEIGVDEITFLDCQFSEREKIRVDRIDNIVTAAMKQSRKPFRTMVNGMTKFDDFINVHTSGQRFIAHCYGEVTRSNLFEELQQLPKDEDVTVLVGPEGDFSIDEVRMAVDRGFRSISLGQSRLRTETAGMMAVAMCQILKQKQEKES